jgi:hypothetical protein
MQDWLVFPIKHDQIRLLQPVLKHWRSTALIDIHTVFSGTGHPLPGRVFEAVDSMFKPGKACLFNRTDVQDQASILIGVETTHEV